MNKCSSWTEFEDKLIEINKIIGHKYEKAQVLSLSQQETAEISNKCLEHLLKFIDNENFEALHLVGEIIDILTEYVDLGELNDSKK